MILPFLFPARVDSVAGPERAKNRAGRGVLRLIQIRLATPSLEKISLVVNKIRCQRGSSIQAPETLSAFHPYE
jgi:hypothetical protein